MYTYTYARVRVCVCVRRDNKVLFSFPHSLSTTSTRAHGTKPFPEEYGSRARILIANTNEIRRFFNLRPFLFSRLSCFTRNCHLIKLRECACVRVCVSVCVCMYTSAYTNTVCVRITRCIATIRLAYIVARKMNCLENQRPYTHILYILHIFITTNWSRLLSSRGEVLPKTVISEFHIV